MPGRAAAIPLALAAALTLAVEASASTGTQPVKFNAADQASARAAVVQRGDVPSSFKGGLVKPDLSDVTCANYRPKNSDLVLTGAAESTWQGSDRFIDSSVHLLRSSRMVQLDFQRSVSLTGVRCVLTNAGAKKVTVSEVALPALGPNQGGYRASFQTSDNGRTVTSILELAVIGKGRFELTLAEFVIAPADTNALHADVVRLAKRMASRIK